MVGGLERAGGHGPQRRRKGRGDQGDPGPAQGRARPQPQGVVPRSRPGSPFEGFSTLRRRWRARRSSSSAGSSPRAITTRLLQEHLRRARRQGAGAQRRDQLRHDGPQLGKDPLSASIKRNGALVKTEANLSLNNGEYAAVKVGWAEPFGSAAGLTPGTAIRRTLRRRARREDRHGALPLQEWRRSHARDRKVQGECQCLGSRSRSSCSPCCSRRPPTRRRDGDDPQRVPRRRPLAGDRGPGIPQAIDGAGTVFNEFQSTKFPERAIPLAARSRPPRPTWSGCRRSRCGASRRRRTAARRRSARSGPRRPRSSRTSSRCCAQLGRPTGSSTSSRSSRPSCRSTPTQTTRPAPGRSPGRAPTSTPG